MSLPLDLNWTYRNQQRNPSYCWSLFVLIIYISIASLWSNQRNVCDAAAVPMALSSPASMLDKSSRIQVALKHVADTNHVNNLTRQHEGDVFITYDMPICNADTCIGLSSGTAGFYKPDAKEIDIIAKYKKSSSTSSTRDVCKCQCLPHLSTFREDFNICVDDINECTLAPFVSGSSAERIPFVILPLRGQIIHPSKEISFPGVKAPICAVAGSQYLTATGWAELRNPIDTDVPFRLYRDEGRTFLQWLGESDLRYRMQGRLILVHLMCRDMAPQQQKHNDGDENTTVTGQHMMHNQNMFSPCVAFRVVGSPIKYVNNVTEVSFQSETHSSSSTTTEGLTTKEYIVIGICSLLLGLIYVASVFLYLHVKKRKSRNSPNCSTSQGSGKNDQVTFNSNFNQSTSPISYGNSRSEIHGNRGSGSGSQQQYPGMSTGLSGEEMGIIKNNPLLKHYPNLGENSGFVSDLSNSASECDDDHPNVMKNMQISTNFHPAELTGRFIGRGISNDNDAPPTQETECLPEENVSIVEDMNSEDKLESMKAIVNGTVRRKLYFNPAYFEPHMLLSPPPAAIEFLTKIREVITIAKYKMATKRFQPSLIMIPEEHPLNDCCAMGKGVQANSSNSLAKSQNSQQLECSGCPGCVESNNKNKTNGSANSNCKNCGDKRNSIRKWLEDVSHHESDRLSDPDNEHNILDKVDSKVNSNSIEKDRKARRDSCSSSDSDTIKANSIGSKSSTKRKAPPIPKSDPPKIISHFLKKEAIKQIDAIPNIYNKTENTINSRSQDLYIKNSIQSLVESNKVCNKTEIYNQLAKVGSEIYNNPQFQFNSPQSFHRNRNRKNSVKSRKAVEVLDQFSEPNRHYEVMKNLHHMPDMIYEAMAKDLNKRNHKHQQQYQYGQINVPDPDYDESYQKFLPGYVDVPPPDYTLGRTKPHYQPDSPIYTRKSPHFLIVDYETDSLERAASKKCRKNADSSPSNGSDLSSQPSPSLSTALPLEEELEVRNTVYDRIEGFRKDSADLTQSALQKLYKEMMIPIEQRIKYDTPYQGSMTIEVEHIPTDYELSTDSEQFEPDTLDRKPKRLNNQMPENQQNKCENEWNRKKANETGSECNYTSLPNVTTAQDYFQNNITPQLVLKSNGSFKSGSVSNFTDPKQANLQKNFSSLREIYEAKTQKSQNTPHLTSAELIALEKGRLLTLEARHSKRQRKTNPESTLKKPMPPDVIPYDNTTGEKLIEGLVVQKNLTGWNTDDKAKAKNNYNNHKTSKERLYDPDTCDTTSSNSESTEFTGVSDTQNNSEFESELQTFGGKVKSKNSKFRINNSIKMNGKNFGKILESNCQKTADNFDQDNQKIEILESFMTLGDIRNKHFIDQQDNSKLDDINSFGVKGKLDMDKIETASIRSLSNQNIAALNSSTSSLIRDLSSSDMRPFDVNINRVMPTKVFRVDVTSPSHGMQIALGLKDRVKKSKDLKNAWKRFVNMATSKFHAGSKSESRTDLECLDKNSVLSDGDEGCSSMHDDNVTISDKGLGNISRTTSHASDCNGRQARSDPDCGYMSADSTECRNKKLYERFNFKNTKMPTIVADQCQTNLNRMQEIKENTESEKSSPRLCTPAGSRNQIERHQLPIRPDNYRKSTVEPIEVNVYSSDDERYNSEVSSETEGDFNLDDVCESGAESVETHSVFFKNVRNTDTNLK